GAHADHLGERTEGDPLAVRQTPAAMPPHDVGEPVDVLLELPRQPRLSDAGDADNGRKRRPPVVAGAVEQLLDQPELPVPSHERRLEGGRAAPTAAVRDAPKCAPEVRTPGLAL